MLDDAFVAAVLLIALPILIALSLLPSVVAWVLDGPDSQEEVGR